MRYDQMHQHHIHQKHIYAQSVINIIVGTIISLIIIILIFTAILFIYLITNVCILVILTALMDIIITVFILIGGVQTPLGVSNELESSLHAFTRPKVYKSNAHNRFKKIGGVSPNIGVR